MARAKRTDRTEARRRYRAETATTATEPGTDGATTVSSSTSRKGASTQAGQPPRPSIMAAFKGAYRPPHIVEDLKAAPQILLHWGFWLAIGLTVVASVVFVVSYSDAVAKVAVGDKDGLNAVLQANTVPFFVGTMFLQPPPAVGAFIIGFTAKRGSWLAGLVYGIFATVAIILVLQTPAGRMLSGDASNEAVLINAAALSPVGSMLFASALAWYRRFLELSNPNRGQRPARGQSAKGGTQKGRAQTSRR
ncbi:MAG: hypothetical protein WCK58_16965 [Chloroflexota bacterium]